MTATSSVRGPCPPPGQAAYWIVHRICTSNPFYVISAGLFLFGLRVSFGPQVRDIELGALMSGLAGYALLLAVTALILVRFGNVWDDIRTVMLLVVLMFLATSVTFDELLVAKPLLGNVCCLGGFAFAVLVSEIVLRGIRLRLPGLFRAPYYLILGLFFLYPVALSPLLNRPKSEALQWGLFGFSTIAGLAFLTLLPAIHRGAGYVADNGSPWRWPLYPWVVFGVLALAAPARAFLLCFSMHWLDLAQGNRTIFGGYFLAPFGLCLAVLLLEIGRVSSSRATTTVAMLLPFGFILASAVGHPTDPVYQGFLRTFRERLGGDPLFWTVIGTAAFYGYAAVRGVEGAIGATTGMLASLSLIGPDSLTVGRTFEPQAWPIALATLLQIGVGVWRRSPWNWTFGGVGAFASVMIAGGRWDNMLLFAAEIHVAILILAIGGALCEGSGGRRLRLAGSLLLLIAVSSLLLGKDRLPASIPGWVAEVYPFAAAAALGWYGVFLSDRVMGAIAAGILAAWLVRTGWLGYCLIRNLLAGFDQIVLSLTLFAIAVAVSLGKSGRLSRWLRDRRWIQPPPDPAEPAIADGEPAS